MKPSAVPSASHAQWSLTTYQMGYFDVEVIFSCHRIAQDERDGAVVDEK